MKIDGQCPTRYRAEALRAGWGLVCLTGPDWVVGRLGGGRPDARSQRVTRLVGARHLTQAVLAGARPSRNVLAVAIWVDAVHSITAVGLALVDRRRWRPAATDAAVAGAWAGLGRRDLDRAGPSSNRWQDRVAARLLPLLPGASSSVSSGR